MSTNDTREPKEAVIDSDKLMTLLSQQDTAQQTDQDDRVGKIEFGYLNPYDVCYLFGDVSWRGLDGNLALSFARAIVETKRLPLQEIRFGRFFVSHEMPPRPAV